jgi:hypothetical protein
MLARKSRDFERGRRMKVLRGGLILATVAVLALSACAAKQPAPSQAILEARQRAAVADLKVKCVELGATHDVPFVFGSAELVDEATRRLDQAIAWTKCTPGAQIALTVDPETHHRQPEKERTLMANRYAVLRAYLAERTAAGVLLAEGAAADPARTLLTIRARGW